MKKQIGLVVLLFITMGVFGQSFIRSRSFVEATPTNWINYVHFFQNDKLYLLSYEPKENPSSCGSRNVYLYSKDINDINSPWKKASGVIMTNSYGTYCYDEVDFFRADKSYGSFGNVVIKDDCIEITIGWSVMNEIINDCVKSELKYKFVADGFGGYLFERIYK